MSPVHLGSWGDSSQLMEHFPLLDTNAPLGVTGITTAAVRIGGAVIELTTTLLQAQSQLRSHWDARRIGSMDVLTAARSSTELMSGLGRAIAELRRVMTIVAKEKRILTAVFLDLFLEV